VVIPQAFSCRIFFVSLKGIYDEYLIFLIFDLVENIDFSSNLLCMYVCMCV